MKVMFMIKPNRNPTVMPLSKKPFKKKPIKKVEEDETNRTAVDRVGITTTNN